MALSETVRTPVRQWPAPLSLLALPVLLYWPALWMRYGFRDDYSTLREAVEEPGKLFGFTSSAGRPVYGLFLEPSFRLLDGIDDLAWWRLASALWIGCAAVLLGWILRRRLGWGAFEAWCTAALITLLPPAQILIGWAICWPHNMAVAVGLLAFAVNDWGLARNGAARRIAACSFGTALLITAILSYQPSGLFYVVPVAAGVLSLSGVRSVQDRLGWLVRHVALVVLGLVAAFGVTKAIFLFGIAEAGGRVAVETAWGDKLLWLLRTPLDNALGLFVLENDLDPTARIHHLVAGLVSAVAVLGGVLEWRRQGVRAAALWFGSGAALALLAYAVSMVAVERWPTYRTMYALSGIVVVYLVRTLVLLGAGQGNRWPWRRHATTGALALLCGIGAWHARHSLVVCHAETQSAELGRLEEAAAQLDPDSQSRVLVLLPHPKQSWAELRYLDEFGSLSADSEWCTKEMLLLLLHERFPDQPELVGRLHFEFASATFTAATASAAASPGTASPGTASPGEAFRYDAVIDLRGAFRRF